MPDAVGRRAGLPLEVAYPDLPPATTQRKPHIPRWITVTSSKTTSMSGAAGLYAWRPSAVKHDAGKLATVWGRPYVVLPRCTT